MQTAHSTGRPNLNRVLLESLGPFSNSAAWDRLLQRVNPTWSAFQIRARLFLRVDENPDTFSLWLEPNRHWTGFRAGQHVRLSVEMDGALRQRTFSLSGTSLRSGPGRPLLRLTIQRQPGSGVTDWLYRHARPGLIVGLTPPEGDFVLPEPVPEQLLMVAGGTGITPMMAMLRELGRDGFRGDITLVQLFRGAGRRLFCAELARLQLHLPGLRILAHDSEKDGRLPLDRLSRLVTDIDRRRVLVCGPGELIGAAQALWQAAGRSDQLQVERFKAPCPNVRSDGRYEVRATRTERVFTQNPNDTLLEAAEAAGINPSYGCRAGLCRTCLCRKQHGTVRNLLTGLSSNEPDEWIQLCISVAESNLDLDL